MSRAALISRRKLLLRLIDLSQAADTAASLAHLRFQDATSDVDVDRTYAEWTARKKEADEAVRLCRNAMVVFERGDLEAQLRMMLEHQAADVLRQVSP